MNEKALARLNIEHDTIQNIWQSMLREVQKVGLDDVLPATAPAHSFAELRVEPLDASEWLYIEWRDKHQSLVGNMLIHDKGNIFAEYGIVRNHPKNSKLFIEAVNAWGNKNKISAELKSMPLIV